MIENIYFFGEICYNECKNQADRRKEMAARCEECANFQYDEDYEDYLCQINLDEDEVARFYSDSHYQCPYYRCGDEYQVVRKQM